MSVPQRGHTYLRTVSCAKRKDCLYRSLPVQRVLLFSQLTAHDRQHISHTIPYEVNSAISTFKCVIYVKSQCVRRILNFKAFLIKAWSACEALGIQNGSNCFGSITLTTSPTPIFTYSSRTISYPWGHNVEQTGHMQVVVIDADDLGERAMYWWEKIFLRRQRSAVYDCEL